MVGGIPCGSKTFDGQSLSDTCENESISKFTN